MYRIPIAVLLLAQAGSALRGVAPEDAHKYEGGMFTCDGGVQIPMGHVNDDYCDCKDGTDEPSTSACAGLEPKMTFWCVNEGHKGEHILQSRINDGICDCCDGTDEFATDAGCTNICVEVATVRAKEQAEMAAKTAAGLEKKAQLIARAKIIIDQKKGESAEWEEQIKKAKSDMETAEVVKTTEEAIEASEREVIKRESEAKKVIHDNERAERDVQKAAVEAEYASAHTAAIAMHGDIVKGGKVAVNKPLSFKNGKSCAKGETGTVSTKDGKLVVTLDGQGFSFEADGHDVVPVEKQVPPTVTEVPNVCKGWTQTAGCDPKGAKEHADTGCSNIIPTGSSGYCECAEDKRYEFTCEHESFTCQQVCEGDGDEGDEITQPCPPEYPYPVKHDSDYGRMVCYNDPALAASGTGPCGTWCARNTEFWETHSCTWGCDCGVECATSDVDVVYKNDDSEPEFVVDTGSGHTREEARHARDEYNNLKTTHDELQRKIDEHATELKMNYGPENEFLPLKGECFEYVTPEYTYKLCPFKEVVQGHTNLGKWGSWGKQTYGAWGGQDDLSIMKYEDGQTCWNGPARSTELKIICGPENIVRTVAEPSMCAYTMVWETPAACVSQ